MLGGQNCGVYVTFLRDVACQKLLNSANVSRSYSQNNTGTVFWDTVYFRFLQNDWAAIDGYSVLLLFLKELTSGNRLRADNSRAL